MGFIKGRGWGLCMYLTGATDKVIIHFFFSFVKLMYKFFGILMRIKKKLRFVKVCYSYPAMTKTLTNKVK